MFKAVIFDLDGTLIDSYAAIAASVNHVRASHHLAPLSVAEVRSHVGRGPAHLLQHTVPNGDGPADLFLYKAHHPSVLHAGTKVLPGVAETLPLLKAAGYALGLCSNKLKRFTCDLLEYLHLAKLFSVVIGPEDAPRLKPAPDMLLAALAQLRVPKEQALYIGDMVVDIQTARAAGIAIWSIPTGSDKVETLQEAQPDHILTSLCELAVLLSPDKR